MFTNQNLIVSSKGTLNDQNILPYKFYHLQLVNFVQFINDFVSISQSPLNRLKRSDLKLLHEDYQGSKRTFMKISNPITRKINYFPQFLF